MADKQTEPAARPGGTWVLLILLALVAYQVYSGVALKKVGVPGVFEVDFADRPAPPPVAIPVASRVFVIGRWKVDQAIGQVSGDTTITYGADGTFTGTATQFVGDVGQKQKTRGRWNFEKQTSDTFRLNVQFDDGAAWTGTFKILDQDRIHNVDQNYVAVRMK